MRRFLLALLSFLVLLCTLPSGTCAQNEDFDVLITDGRVIDGTGNPWFYADVGVRDGRIAAIGKLDDAEADRTVEAEGKYVVPGFIDIHSHAADADGGLTHEEKKYRAAPNLVMQGVTTIVGNQDGGGQWPIAPQKRQMEEEGIGPNAILLVGHGNIREEVMGDDYRREATPQEIREMEKLVRQGMEAGALGFSGGYEYIPDRWASTEEIAALVDEVKPWNGVYIPHHRASGATPTWWWPSQHDPDTFTMLESVVETIEIAERTGVPSVMTHIKIRGANYWGSSEAVIHQIERARERGVPMWADQYPYNTTGSDGSMVMIAPWVLEKAKEEASEDEKPDYAATLRELLDDSTTAAKVRMDARHEMYRRGGPANILILEHPNEDLVGKTLLEAAQDRGVTPVRMALLLQLEGDPHEPGGARVRGFSLSEHDVENFMDEPWMATSTDGAVSLPGDGPVHPRYYGTYPRKIHEYVHKREVISLEFAIRSMTSLPAQIMGLHNRGTIQKGNWADITVFDPERIRDRSTAMNPYKEPKGVEHVLINGEFVLDDGEPTGALPGRVISADDRSRLD